jgi:transposase
MDTECSRGLRYLLFEQDNEITEYAEAYRKGFAIVSKHVFNNYPNLPSYNFKYRLEGKDKDLKQTILEEVKEQLETIGITSYQRNIVLAVLSNYQSFRKLNRRSKKKNNGFPSKPIMLKRDKAIRFDDQCVREKDGQFTMPGLNGSRISIKFTHPGTTAKFKQYFNPEVNFGGTLVYESNQWRFTARYKKPIQYQYKPKKWVGTDFNATGDKFVVLSDGTEFARSQSVQKLEADIDQVNTLLRDSSTTGGYRRKLNNKRKALHKKHRGLINPITDQVIEYIIKHQAGLAIDEVTGTGQTSGTWGQDKIIPKLIQMCQDQGIPYYISNPRFTSQTCNQCSYRHENNRKNKEEFECQECGHKCCAHLNGAINAANAAARENV